MIRPRLHRNLSQPTIDSREGLLTADAVKKIQHHRHRAVYGGKRQEQYHRVREHELAQTDAAMGGVPDRRGVDQTVLYLVIRDGKAALNRFAILFGEHVLSL